HAFMPKLMGSCTPSIIHASPSSKCSMRGARSRSLAGTRSRQSEGGSFTWLSAEMSRYESRGRNFTSIVRSDTRVARAASVFVVSITPFDAAGRVDEAGLRAHLQRMVAAGIGVYVGGGGSGEGFVLTSDERRRILEVASEELRGRVPFRSMGVETRSAAEMI